MIFSPVLYTVAGCIEVSRITKYDYVQRIWRNCLNHNKIWRNCVIGILMQYNLKRTKYALKLWTVVPLYPILSINKEKHFSPKITRNQIPKISKYNEWLPPNIYCSRFEYPGAWNLNHFKMLINGLFKGWKGVRNNCTSSCMEDR